jgi:hypothetical protein
MAGAEYANVVAIAEKALLFTKARRDGVENSSEFMMGMELVESLRADLMAREGDHGAAAVPENSRRAATG